MPVGESICLTEPVRPQRSSRLELRGKHDWRRPAFAYEKQADVKEERSSLGVVGAAHFWNYGANRLWANPSGAANPLPDER